MDVLIWLVVDLYGSFMEVHSSSSTLDLHCNRNYHVQLAETRTSNVYKRENNGSNTHTSK